jgi:uncharacterized protein
MVKYLVVVLVVLAVVWLLRGQRRHDQTETRPRAAGPRPDTVQEMVSCAHCGVHLPVGEALRGPDGRPYCSAAHCMAGPR